MNTEIETTIREFVTDISAMARKEALAKIATALGVTETARVKPPTAWKRPSGGRPKNTDRIVKALRGTPGGVLSATLRSKLGMEKTQYQRAIGELLSAGKIRKTGTGLTTKYVVA